MATTALFPNQQNNINVIPGFENTTYSGVPIKGFLKGPWRKIRAALGNISQDGSTMLDVLDQKDPGAGPGTPGGAGTAAQQGQHAARDRRLYAIICKLTQTDCGLMIDLETDFVDQGRLAAIHFRNENNLPLTPDERDTLQSEWTAATVVTLGIPIDAKCMFALLNWVRTKADDFVPPKNNREQYGKILSGAPECLFQEVVQEQRRVNLAPPAPTHVFPANYPANHPQVGNPHAFAGQPDPTTLVKVLSSHLRLMIDKGLVRVKGDKIHEVTEDDNDDEDVNFVRKSKFDKFSHKRNTFGKNKAGQPVELTETSRCFRCGGLGHFAITNGQKCLTTIRINRDVLDKITYPHIKNERPVPKNLTVNEVTDSEDENEDDQEGDDNVELIETDDENDKNVNEIDSDGDSESDLMHEF